MVGGRTESLCLQAQRQSRLQRPAEVCDGECSWCLSLSVGHSYRQGLSCFTIKTQRGQRGPSKAKHTHTLTSQSIHAATQTAMFSENYRLHQSIMQFLQTNQDPLLCFFLSSSLVCLISPVWMFKKTLKVFPTQRFYFFPGKYILKQLSKNYPQI